MASSVAWQCIAIIQAMMARQQTAGLHSMLDAVYGIASVEAIGYECPM